MPLASQQLSTPDLRQPRFQTALFSSLPFLLIYEINNWMESWHTVERDDFKFKVLKGKKKEKKIGEKNRETRISRRRQKAVIYRWLIRVNGSPLLPKSLFCASSIHLHEKGAHFACVRSFYRRLISYGSRCDHPSPKKSFLYLRKNDATTKSNRESLSLSLETNRIERIIKRLNGANGSLSLSLSLSNLPLPPPRDLLSCYGTITRGKSPE